MVGQRTYAVITTINEPTPAVRRFAELLPGHTIVIGDRKTPESWKAEGVHYFDVLAQENRFGELARAIPFNHYARKNLGYLEAVSAGAEVVFDTDDDNIPYDQWSIPPLGPTQAALIEAKGFVNVYTAFTDQFIWPRGMPLNRIRDDRTVIHRKDLSEEKVFVGVWQGLADREPDVDAIYRLVVGAECTFNQAPPVVLSNGCYSPYNSQNTATARSFAATLYLPAFVTFRYTDILRGYIGQIVLQAAGCYVGCHAATVWQERNLHDLMRDFRDEIPVYLDASEIMTGLERAVSANRTIAENMRHAYRHLKLEGVVQQEECELLDLFLKALAALDSDLA